MNFVKIDGKIINLDVLVSAFLDEPTQTLYLQMTHAQLTFPLNDSTQAAYDWLVSQCVETFDAAQEEDTVHGLSASAWNMLKRIEYQENRTDLPGLAIGDDDTEVTIELERGGYIRTDVHYAWLTGAGRALLAEHHAEKAREGAD